MDQSVDAFVVSLEGMREVYERRRKAAIFEDDAQMAEACQNLITHTEKMIRQELESVPSSH